MFKNIDEVRQFIEWATKMGLARAKIGNVEFEVSPMKSAEVVSNGQFMDPEPEREIKQEDDSDYQMPDDPNRMTKEEQELLYHSSGG